MRSFNSLRNVSIAILYEIVILAFGLIVPKLITTTYGSEVNGLTTTVNYVLQILNLLQAGAAGASIFQLFKPVAEKDYEKVSVIMDATRKFFCKIGTIFLICVFALSPLFGLFVNGNNVGFTEKFLAFIILGVNGATYMYFFTYFDVLFSSHQKRFILSLSRIVGKVAYYGMVIAIALLRLNYMLIYVATVISTLIDVLILYVVYRKELRPLIQKVPKDNNFKIPNKVYLFVDQVAIQSIASIPVVFASLIADLNTASVISYYYLVFNTVRMIVNTMQLSVCEVFGNFIVSKSESEIKRVFNLLDFCFAVVGIFAAICTAFLFSAFMFVYTDGNTLTDKVGNFVNYMVPSLPVLFVVLFIFFCVKQPYYMLTNVYGLYKETYLQSAISAVIGFGISLGLGLLFWPCVLLGPIFFEFSSYVYRITVAKKNLKWLSFKKSLLRFAVMLIGAAGGFLAERFFYGAYPTAWIEWIVAALITVCVSAALLGIYTLLFERKELLSTLSYGKAILFRGRNERKVAE